MTKNWMRSLFVVLSVALVATTLFLVLRGPAEVAAQGGKGTNTGPRYSVVETQGHNLLVTDNNTNTLYFYTIDKDAKVGAELKLRASIDLTQVGKPEIKISESKSK